MGGRLQWLWDRGNCFRKGGGVELLQRLLEGLCKRRCASTCARALSALPHACDGRDDCSGCSAAVQRCGSGRRAEGRGRRKSNNGAVTPRCDEFVLSFFLSPFDHLSHAASAAGLITHPRCIALYGEKRRVRATRMQKGTFRRLSFVASNGGNSFVALFLRLRCGKGEKSSGGQCACVRVCVCVCVKESSVMAKRCEFGNTRDERGREERGRGSERTDVLPQRH